MDDYSPMNTALLQARAAGERGEVPVGAVVVDPSSGEFLAAEGNRTRELTDPSAHAEILAIRAACRKLGSERLTGLDLYVTLEPCPACASIISAARIRRLYFGAFDPKTGGLGQGPRIFAHPQAHHKPEVYGGIREDECGAILRTFFALKRGAG